MKTKFGRVIFKDLSNLALKSVCYERHMPPEWGARGENGRLGIRTYRVYNEMSLETVYDDLLTFMNLPYFRTPEGLCFCEYNGLWYYGINKADLIHVIRGNLC